MIGFRATADANTPLDVDTDELVSAGWFSRADVLAATRVEGATLDKAVALQALARDPTMRLLIPPSGELARTLIETWLGEGTE
mmetsp:Transcript_31622/g.67986  ORF Transcript_31622/g.67986 Transcript_31622/m.67986 type:complete len:83 (-) Transcript_31622:136-384(-)